VADDRRIDEGARGDAPRRTPALRTLPLDRYTDFKPAGQGGMGIVYWAIDTDLNREVAFKVVRPDVGEDEPLATTPQAPVGLSPPKKGTPATDAFETLKARFLQEAWVTGGLSHPGIVPVYEMGQTPEGVPYYTMRFVRGKRTLKDAIEESKGKGIEERLALLEPFLKVCDTISYVHARGVIHRDLKPENVALGEFGEVVVLDWGLAKLKDRPDLAQDRWQDQVRRYREAADLRTVVSAMGTPGYMAPEAARGDVAAMDERSDVYSLGAILFQILTGRLPHAFTTYEGFLEKTLTEEPPAATAIDPAIPSALSDLCARALSREKERRPESAERIVAALRAWQAQSAADREVDDLLRDAKAALAAADGLTGDASLHAIDRAAVACSAVLQRRPDDVRAREMHESLATRRERGTRQRERAARWRLLRRIGAVAVVGLGVAAYVVGKEIRDGRARARAWALASAAEAATSDSQLALLLAREAARNAPLPRVMGRLQESLRMARGRHVLRPPQPTRGSHTGVQVLGLATDADGKRVLAWHAGNLGVSIWDGDGREIGTFLATPDVTGPPDILEAGFLSGDGGAFAVRRDGSLVFWEIPSGKVRRTFSVGRAVEEAALSPKGNLLLVRAEGDRWGLADAERQHLVELPGTAEAACFSGDGTEVILGEGRTVRVLDVQGREVDRVPVGVEIARVRASPVGRHFAVVERLGRSAEIWTRAGARSAKIDWGVAMRVDQELGPFPNLDVTFSPAGDRVLATTVDGLARLFTVDGRLDATLRGHATAFLRARFSPSGDAILTASADGSARLWDLQGREQGRFTGSVDAEFSSLVDAVFLGAGERTVTAPYGGPAILWDVQDADLPLLQAHEGVVPFLRFTRDGRLLTAGEDGAIRLWNEDGGPAATLRERGSAVRSVEIDDSGRVVLAVFADDTARLLGTDGRALPGLRDAGSDVTNAALSPDGARVAVVTRGGTARVFDSGGGDPVVLGESSPRPGASPAVTTIAFSADGSLIATAGSHGSEPRVWGRDGRVVATLPSAYVVTLRPSAVEGGFLAQDTNGSWSLLRPEGGAWRTWHLDALGRGRLALSASGDLMATSTRGFVRAGPFDRLRMAREHDSGLPVFPHDAEVLATAFSTDGRHLLNGCVDGTAWLWNLRGAFIAHLPGDPPVRAVAFSPSGDRCATASDDGSVRIWRVDAESVIDLAERRAIRSFTELERRRFEDLLGED
jgi:serine/threonine protein kinase/WD40 repeat protein